MLNQNKIIKEAKEFINMPHNQFNLNNYKDVLNKWGHTIIPAYKESVIANMSGNNPEAGIHANYIGGTKVLLVGKGILFDSGGLNIKTRGMGTMYTDKAGMITAMAVDKIVDNHDVGCLCPITENMLQHSNIYPGDIYKIGKKQVTVNDTDAEGRLILAEALATIPKNYLHKNAVVITIATLTGAVGYAIDRATGVFSPNNNLANLYLTCAEQAKERAWRLPLWEDLDKKYYSKTSIKNYNKEILAGASEAALFVKQFVPNPNQWIHLDIAYSAFNADDTANGQPIKTLVKFTDALAKRIK